MPEEYAPPAPLEPAPTTPALPLSSKGAGGVPPPPPPSALVESPSLTLESGSAGQRRSVNARSPAITNKTGRQQELLPPKGQQNAGRRSNEGLLKRDIIKEQDHGIVIAVDDILSNNFLKKSKSLDEEDIDSKIENPDKSAGRLANEEDEDFVVKMTEKNSNVSSSIALFDIDEIVLGKKIGSGRFVDTFEVKSFKLSSVNEKDIDMCTQWTRDCLKENVKQRKYVIRHMKETLSNDPTHFEKAASHLSNEIDILTTVRRHSSIMPVRGIAIHGTEAYYLTGRYDSYFVIMDRITENLEDRIEKWQRASKRRRSISFGIKPKKKRTPIHFLKTRLHVAFDLATVLEYLHSQYFIVVRDLQPQNIAVIHQQHADPNNEPGIASSSGGAAGGGGSGGESDTSDDVTIQLYDFALAKRLPSMNGCLNDEDDEIQGNNNNNEEQFAFDGKYDDEDEYEDFEQDLDGNDQDTEIGNLNALPNHRYLAPELKARESYSTQADVYSFTTILSEVVTLKQLDPQQFLKKLQKSNSRTNITNGAPPSPGGRKAPQRSLSGSSVDSNGCVGYGKNASNATAVDIPIPKDIKKLMERGWSLNPRDRPSMSQICSTIRKVIIDLHNAETMAAHAAQLKNAAQAKKN